MQHTATGTITAVGATSTTFIGTSVDIPTALFFLLFFSILHAVTFNFYNRRDDSEKVLFWIDILSLIYVAAGVGIIGGMIAILQGYTEGWVYLYLIGGSIIGIQGPSLVYEFIRKKLGLSNKEKND